MKLTCNRGPLHKGIILDLIIGESLDLICFNESCLVDSQPLNCVICIEENHVGHDLIHINNY